MLLGTIPPAGWRRLLFFISGALVLVVVGGTYLPKERVDYVWDDHALVEHHMATDDPSTSLGSAFLKPFWRTDAAAEKPTPYYRPLVVLSYRFDRALDDGIAAQNRSTNLLLHLLSCVFLALLAIRLGATPPAGILASLIWGLSPRLAESVAWISGRTDVLACTLGLAAMLVMPLPLSATAPDTTHPRWPMTLAAVRAILAGGLLFLALMSKEVAVAFALAMTVACLWGPLPSSASIVRRGGLFAVSVIAPTAVYFALRTTALGGVRLDAGRSLPLGLRVVTAFETIGRYAEMIVDPFHPSASIGYVGEPDILRVSLGVAVALALLFALYVWREPIRQPGTMMIVTLLAVSIGVVAQILPLNLSGSVAADRLLYIPLAAITLLFAVLARRIESHPSRVRLIVAGAAFVLAAGESLRTEARSADFLNDARLWVSTAESSHPHNTMPMSALAAVLREDGEVDRACQLLSTSHRILNSSPYASAATRSRTVENLASCLSLVGRYDEALELIEGRAREQPDSPRVIVALGFMRLHVLDVDGAEDAFRRAYELDANQPGGRLHQRTILTALERLPFIRADLAAFRDDARSLRGDIVRYARFLARVGRLPEAQDAFMRIATDASAPAKIRAEAVEFLAMYGAFDLLVRAQRACESVPLDGVIEARLAKRWSTHKRLAPFLPRIDALLARSSR